MKKCNHRIGRLPWLAVVLAAAMAPVVGAAERADRSAGTAAKSAEVVEMFAGIEQGQLEVKLIPKDATECRVLIRNKTDKPLSVKLPEAFAGVPVLAQVGGGGNNNNNNNNNMNQGMGGGMGMGGMGMGGMGGGGMGGGGGFFNVAPEKVGQLKVATVCLDHGKRDPRPAVPYEIKPIESYTSKVEVQEICKLLGKGLVNQRAAQVAAWHLNNGLSLEQLAGKELRFADGSRRPYFSPQELQAGIQVVVVATKLAREKQEQSSGKSGSLSQK